MGASALDNAVLACNVIKSFRVVWIAVRRVRKERFRRADWCFYFNSVIPRFKAMDNFNVMFGIDIVVWNKICMYIQ
jgi:hypothetical protein